MALWKEERRVLFRATSWAVPLWLAEVPRHEGRPVGAQPAQEGAVPSPLMLVVLRSSPRAFTSQRHHRGAASPFALPSRVS